MANWAKPPMDRRQVTLFSPTLDQMIPEDDPVRLLDEILGSVDWSGWEAHYVLVAGQPPIHPRTLVSAILYGLSLGIRSSRKLEEACKRRLDFIWLVEGRTIDHSTFSAFRTRHARELKELFGQLCRVAMRMGAISLNQVALDGTRVRAQSSRHGTASAKTLAEKLGQLDRQIEELFAQAEEADRREQELFGGSSSSSLPKSLSNLQRRQKRLRKALAAAEERDAGGRGSKRAKVPVADPDSSIQRNKEGGYAPNYTPVVTTDGQEGLIVDADVLDDSNEAQAMLPAVDRVCERFGDRPKQVLADSIYGSGENLTGLSEREVEGYIPMEQREDSQDNPARRAKLSEPVLREDWPKLPRNRRKKRLGRHAFVYQASEDCYWCPMGKKLWFIGVKRHRRRHGTVSYRAYQCRSCVGCPLAGECLPAKGAFRMVGRDGHEDLREAMEARLRSREGKAVYGRRKWLAETPFGLLKGAMGVRQFLLRGLGKVKTEWLWCCTAFNLLKIIRKVAALRARFAAALG